MYLLIFQAWATLLGFTKLEDNPIAFYNNSLFAVEGENQEQIWNWGTLASMDPKAIYGDSIWGALQQESAMIQNNLMLTNILTHVSMILIFILFVSFIIWLFRLFGHMLSRR